MSFTFNEQTFEGQELGLTSHESGIQFDYKGRGSARRAYTIRRSSAQEFRDAALGGVENVAGVVSLTNRATHPDFSDLFASEVEFQPYSFEPGETSDTDMWLKVVVVFASSEHGQPGANSNDNNQDTEIWRETWKTSLKVIPREMVVGSSQTQTLPIYFPGGELSFNRPRVPNFNPMGVLSAYAGKVNETALVTPSGVPLAAEVLLYVGVEATAIRKASGLLEWDVTHHFGVDPITWNQYRDAKGVVQPVKWPGTEDPAYEPADMATLLDV